jgi:hypothetical protein
MQKTFRVDGKNVRLLVLKGYRAPWVDDLRWLLYVKSIPEADCKPVQEGGKS